MTAVSHRNYLIGIQTGVPDQGLQLLATGQFGFHKDKKPQDYLVLPMKGGYLIDDAGIIAGLKKEKDLPSDLITCGSSRVGFFDRIVQVVEQRFKFEPEKSHDYIRRLTTLKASGHALKFTRLELPVEKPTIMRAPDSEDESDGLDLSDEDKHPEAIPDEDPGWQRQLIPLIKGIKTSMIYQESSEGGLGKTKAWLQSLVKKGLVKAGEYTYFIATPRQALNLETGQVLRNLNPGYYHTKEVQFINQGGRPFGAIQPWMEPTKVQGPSNPQLRLSEIMSQLTLNDEVTATSIAKKTGWEKQDINHDLYLLEGEKLVERNAEKNPPKWKLASAYRKPEGYLQIPKSSITKEKAVGRIFRAVKKTAQNCYIFGGAIRDWVFLGETPSDIDIAGSTLVIPSRSLISKTITQQNLVQYTISIDGEEVIIDHVNEVLRNKRPVPCTDVDGLEFSRFGISRSKPEAWNIPIEAVVAHIKAKEFVPLDEGPEARRRFYRLIDKGWTPIVWDPRRVVG
jgi:hypothetical protein